jgi:hypothetical protein
MIRKEQLRVNKIIGKEDTLFRALSYHPVTFWLFLFMRVLCSIAILSQNLLVDPSCLIPFN